MTAALVVNLYWWDREESPAGSGGRLQRYLRALAAIDPALARFVHRDEATQREHELNSSLAWEESIRRSEVKWRTGKTERQSYQGRYLASAPGGAECPAELELTTGIGRLDLGPMFTPERAGFSLADQPGWREPGWLQAVLRAGVEAFEPCFGYVGTPTDPQKPLPLSSAGVPPVGWLTYLSSAYPPLPPLRTPTVVSGVGSLGTVIVAHPSPLRPGSPEQREAITAVQAALQQSGVLLPAPAVRNMARG